MINSQSMLFLICAILTFAATAVAGRFIIPKLRSHKLGQKILDIGPRWHKSKEGTPTMGGLAFLVGSGVCVLAVIGYAVFNGVPDGALAFIITLAMAYLNGAIGLIDDYAKLVKKRNEGLSAKQKYLLQLAVAGAYLFVMRVTGNLTTELFVPYFNITAELGIFYYPIALLLLTGVINASNLTDGIDGLLGSVTFVIGGFFAVASITAGNTGTVVLSALTVGSAAGFLIYNFYPAKVFMGDTGSLFLGALTVGSAFLLGNPLIILVCGIVYIAEAGSVIMQVLYFKATGGKRLFKMAPLHHHFELCGRNEIQIVLIFSAVTLVFSVLAYFGL